MDDRRQRFYERLRRLQGQLDGAGRALKEDKPIGMVFHNLAAARAALDVLMMKMLKERILSLKPRTQATPTELGAQEELLELFDTYFGPRRRGPAGD